MAIYNNASEVWLAISQATSVNNIDLILQDSSNSNIILDANDLKNLALSQSVNSGSANTVILYSGNIDGQNSGAIANKIADSSNGTVAIIDKTDAANLITKPGFESALSKSFNGDRPDINSFLFGETDSSGTRVSHGLWGDLSEKFVTENNFTEVKTIAPNAGADSILMQKEITAILDKADTTIQKIDGIDISDLKSTYQSQGLEVVQSQIKQSSGANFTLLETAKDANGNLVVGTEKFFANSPSDIQTTSLPVDANEIKSGANILGHDSAWKGFLNDLTDTHVLSKATLTKLGVAGDILSFTLAATKAEAAIDDGNHNQAANIMENWTAEFLGSIAGSAATVALISPLIIALAPGAIVAGTIAIATGIVGGIFGGEAGVYLLDKAKEFGTYVDDDLSNFVDALKNELQDLLGQSLIGNSIQDYLNSLHQAEATQPIRRYDPLTLDLNNNGKIDLVSLSNSNTFFDLDNDGLREKVGWVKADDGILIFDQNNNQSVDNIEELFGYQNPDGSHVTGTQELATHDLNNDGKINSSDAIFNQLKVWQDLNQDGISQSGELKTLSQLNINQINLTNITNLNQNVEGNVIISQGTYQTSDNQTHNLFNLDLAIDQTNSASYQYQDNQGNNITYDLNLDTLSLPFSRGYGNATAWHIAMSEDEELLNIMKEITNLDLNDQNSLKNLDQKIEEFIYQWTGTENITGNRGSFDAKKLAVLEAIRGEVYHDLTGSNNVGPLQVNFVQTAWDQFFNSIKNKILIQSLFKDVFAGAHYDFATDSIDFNNLTATQLFDNIEAQYDSLSAINQVYFAYDIYKFANLTIGKINGINDLTTFKNLLEAQIGISPDNFAFGTDGNETIYFNNIENNVIDSKKGDDLLAGGNGDDIYIFNLGDGRDACPQGKNALRF